MNLIKSAVVTLFISMGTIVVIDVIGYQFHDELAHLFNTGYGVAFDDFDRGYPRGYFRHDEDVGFDITPNFQTTTSSKPREYGSYDVWGNSYGCFDDEWHNEQLAGGIYLAGDSFTWGYVRYEKKFGTLLEELVKKKVYACGVTHTGQGHQFEKFKRLYKRGLRPSLVIVNVYANDLSNDFFFPHTDIIDGFMVENIERCGSASFEYSELLHDEIDSFVSNFKFSRLSHDELTGDVAEKIGEGETLKSLLKQYSLSASIVAEVTKPLRTAAFVKIKQSEACFRSVYFGLENIRGGYSSSKLTEANRKYIVDWIDHSVSLGYRLLFSFIPSKYPSRDDTFPHIEKYITENSGIYSSFNDFCDASCREDNAVYFRYDGHFNENGNELYAKYLATVIAAYADK